MDKENVRLYFRAEEMHWIMHGAEGMMKSDFHLVFG